jgi:hypothetical protein
MATFDPAFDIEHENGVYPPAFDLQGGDTPTPSTALLFADSAAKLLNRNSPASRASVVDGSGDVTFTIYNTNSTINGTPLTGGGLVDEKDVPFGYSCPIRGGWILTEPQYPIDPDPSLNFANGMSNLFVFEGQVFEFKSGNLGAGSFAVRWSEDDGITWKQIYQGSSDDQNWYQFDFGSAGTRIVEVIGCDQTLALNGYNFDTGTTPPAAYEDATLPMVTMFGDSYVFGQNADAYDNTSGDGTNANDQNAIFGQTRVLGEYLGCLQVRNHGLRGNRFSPGQTNRSKYADRLSGGVYPTVAEALVDIDSGTVDRDLFIIPSTVNDDGPGNDGVRRTACAEAFSRLRELQPNCMIMFPVGARAPQWTESETWLDDYKNGFADVFGSSESEWIENGAYLHDGSRRDGADWTPSGAEGSSIYFGELGYDTGHPTQLGHDLLAQKYSEGAIYMAKEIVKSAVDQGFGTELFDDNWTNIGSNWTDNGNDTYTCTPDGINPSSLGLNIPEIEGGQAYVVRLTVDLSAGELRVRLGGGSNQSITSSGSYSFVLDDNSSAGLILQGMITFLGTVSNVSCRALY